LLKSKNKYEFGLMHAEYFAGIAKYDYAGFSTVVDSTSRLGVSVIRFGVDDIPDTRFLYDANGVLDYSRVRFFSSSDYAFTVSYAKQVKKLRLGMNLKVIHRIAGEFATAWGFGADAGMQYDFGKWTVGVMARDITTTFTAWNNNLALLYQIYAQTGNQISKNYTEITLPKLNIGIARTFIIRENFGLKTALEVQATFDGKRNTIVPSDITSISPSFGIEADYQKKVFLRTGIGNIQKIKNFNGSEYLTQQFNFGVGFTFSRFTIDYALAQMISAETGLFSHIFSVKAVF
jgi:hypothetical protein